MGVCSRSLATHQAWWPRCEDRGEDSSGASTAGSDRTAQREAALFHISHKMHELFARRRGDSQTGERRVVPKLHSKAMGGRGERSAAPPRCSRSLRGRVAKERSKDARSEIGDELWRGGDVSR